MTSSGFEACIVEFLGVYARSRRRREVTRWMLLLVLMGCSLCVGAQTVLVGNSAVEANLDSDSVGTAEAFPATAAVSGQVGSVNLFLDESSTATTVYVGIYRDASGQPGTLLTQGSATQLFPGTWNTVPITAVSLTTGTPYWIAVLGASGGKPYFYDRSTTSCQSQTSSQINLTSLPSSWVKGKSWNTCYLSAYAVSGTYAATVILGDQALETNLDKNAAGQAEAFPVAANSSGSVTGLALYLDPTSGAGPVYAGLYTDNGGKPGSLLAQGSTSSPLPGQWNQIAITSSSVTAGKKYWIAILGTQATSPYFRDRQTTACKSQTSSQTTLTSLPSTWSAGSNWSTCYIAAYGSSGTGLPVLSATPTNLSFSAIQGGTNPAPANLTVSNTGTGTLAFTDAGDSSWLSVSPSSGTAPQTLQVSTTLGTLTPGNYTGHVTVTAPGATNSPATTVVTLNVAPFIPPSITASTNPPANANGWNDSSVTVSFTCTAGSYAIQSCPSPVVVSTQGAGQAIAGTVVDAAGDTNSVKVTLNIDLTAPTVSIGSPANGAFLTSSPTSVTGSISDSLSGIASVTCNGTNGTVQGGSYSCSVPLNGGTDTVSVKATDVAGNISSQSVSATLIVAASIGNFSPSSSSIGSIVTVQGSGFIQSGFQPTVTLNQEGGGTIAAPLSSVAANTLSFVIPSGAASGPISITLDGVTATSSTPLTVVGSSSFSLSAGPSSVTLVPGQTTNVQISLTSTNGFAQLASLSASGLPGGVTASFQPSQITAGGFSILTVSAPSGQITGTSTLTVSASATVQGMLETQTTPVLLNVQSLTGSTGFVGRVAVTDAYDTPLVGVTVSFTGKNYTGAQTGCSGSTTTDSAGNFAFTNLSSSCIGSQLVSYDPSTVTAPVGRYSGVNLSYVLTSGQVTTPGIIVHLPNVSGAETFSISQNSPSDQTFSSRTIPGVSITIYAGTTFTLADGSQPDPFPLSVVEIPYDKIPDYMPPNPTEDPWFAMSIEPYNSSSSQPIAVSYPNRTHATPGTDMPLTSLNPTMGMMVNYGTGSVSPDATQVVPDPDPANRGHLYGISHFDWHFPVPPPHAGCTQNCTTPQTSPNPCPDCDVPEYGDPVDPSSGLIVINHTDIGLTNSRSQIAVQRTFRGMSGVTGPFGIGTSLNYNYVLDTSYVSTISGASGSIILDMPDGNQFYFVGVAGGTYTNTTVPSLGGAVISNLGGGSLSLRFKDGTIFQFCQCQGSFNPFAVLTGIIDPSGNKITIVRNIFGNQIQIFRVVDAVGRALNFGYDSSSRITSISDPIGRAVYYSYNSQGMLATITDTAGGVTSYGYDQNNNLTTITDPNHNTYTNTYDPNGRVTQQQAPDGGIIQFSFTLFNPTVPTSPVNYTTVTDARGNPTIYHFNPSGFLLDRTDAKGQKYVYEVDPATNKIASITDPLKRVTAYTYDGSGNLLTITRLSGTSGAVETTFQYDPTFNKVTSVADPLSHTTTSTYDPNTGNILTTTDPLGQVTSYTYDRFGEVQTMTDPMGNTTQFTYSNGDLSSITDPLGRVVTRNYDGVSRVVAVTNPLGRTTQYQYDAMNKTALIIDPTGNHVAFDYDANGNLLRFWDPNGHSIVNTYDPMDRLATEADLLGHIEQYTYDKNGNLHSFTDRRGKISQYDYDELNRLTSANFGPGESSTTYNYDSGGRLTQTVDSVVGSISRTFDGLDQILTEQTSLGSVSYSYDAAGRRTSTQASGQSQIGYSYDDSDRVSAIQQASSVASYNYDKDGRRISATLPNGVAVGYAFDKASQLSGLNYQIGNTVLGDLSYGYDLAGRRTSVGGSMAKTGMPQASTASYNAANQVVSWSSQSITYDANGNLQSDGLNTYTWDAKNQLVSIAGAVNASFQYDPFGRRVSKTVNGATTAYLYDGDTPLLELNGGMVTASNLPGAATDEVIQRTDTSGTVVLLPDALGSTLSTVNAAGATVSTFTYEPYGNTTVSGNAQNPHQFTGRDNDGTGLYYYRARYYSPKFGRFISEDPAGLTGGANLYRYALDSPFTFKDPFGLTATCYYAQDTGHLVCYDDDSGSKIVDVTAYSGGNEGRNPGGVNNMGDQYTNDVGPIPTGDYKIGTDDGRISGGYSLPLTPLPGTNVGGKKGHPRSGFYIHADNACQCHSASKGCIVTPRGPKGYNARKAINDAGGGILYVNPSELDLAPANVCSGGVCTI